jgi:hypothetical protein
MENTLAKALLTSLLLTKEQLDQSRASELATRLALGEINQPGFDFQDAYERHLLGPEVMDLLDICGKENEALRSIDLSVGQS